MVTIIIVTPGKRMQVSFLIPQCRHTAFPSYFALLLSCWFTEPVFFLMYCINLLINMPYEISTSFKITF